MGCTGAQGRKEVMRPEWMWEGKKEKLVTSIFWLINNWSGVACSPAEIQIREEGQLVERQGEC